MNDSYDSLPRRDFLKALGVAALPLLTTACDDEPVEQSVEPSFRGKSKSGSVDVGRALLEQALISDRQRCSLPAKMVGYAQIGQQVRITHPEYGSALYTVDELRKDDNPDYVRMNLSARLRLGTTNGFSGQLSNRLTASSLSDAQAEAQSEFVERTVVGDGSGLVILAPHGGGIEPRTDSQAEQVTSSLSGLGVSSWICKGWNQGGGAFDRWHIRSTDLSPLSFPGLGYLTKRKYAYSVAFHGMDVGGVLIGGSGPEWLKQQIAFAIRAAVGNLLEIGVADPTDVYDGDSPDNLVNWVTEGGSGGIQIEQSRQARVDYWDAIAGAVANVFGEIL